jgi:drug/metabolite transporter (DMT)-like permease
MATLGMSFSRTRSGGDWAILAASGVMGLAVADTLFFAGLRRLDASVVAITDCAYAPSIFLLSALFLGETFRATLLLGAPLVVLGLFLASFRPRRADAAPVDRTGLLFSVLGVITTAVGIVMAKPALASSELIEATTVRLLAGTGALLLYHLFARSLPTALVLFRPQRAWKFAVPGTVFGAYVAMILWLGGMRLGSASRTSVLNQLGAIFVLVLSRLLGEHVPKRRWLGAGLAVTGACVVLAG